MKCKEPKKERCVARVFDKQKFVVVECTHCGKLEASDKEDKVVTEICDAFNIYRLCKLDKAAVPEISPYAHPFTEEIVTIVLN